ncbi:E3 ubiquitin-protein ligase MARCHF2 [Parasteatoda tepidariorum]|uniref:E3 ubiquitin-protein ligase MARCHF2 n=1 Tax=Parasteatoda tepidariorum TaxID=114398 RepID=UPI00077FB79C|nr:E3 ubiquitin-protein ligase MARCHF2 [Parasteatoda tepidariorum]
MQEILCPNSDGNSAKTLTTDKVPSDVVLQVGNLENNQMCRICYSGPSRERLLRPCKCKGTIEYVHRNCLERWLETTNYEACELCHHHFTTRRTRKSCWEWWKQEDTQNDRRNLAGDCTCCLFLTPLGVATFWLCIEGAVYYFKVKNSTVETVALVILAIFLIFAYFTWIVLCARYHIMIWRRWRNRSWNVQVVDRQSSLESSPVTSEESLTLQSTPGAILLLEPLIPVVQADRSHAGHSTDSEPSPPASNIQYITITSRVTTV